MSKGLNPGIASVEKYLPGSKEHMDAIIESINGKCHNMKTKLTFTLLLTVVVLSLFGCQDANRKENNEKEGNGMYKVDIYDFSFIKKAPEATEKQDLEKVIKVYFNENDSSLNKGFAINIEEEEVFVNSGMGSRGIRTSAVEPINISDIDGLIEILKKYKVQNWKKDYTFEDPNSYQDGYGWQLWLQFEDGTVEKHKGSGTNIEKITPENFGEFFHELNDFMNERLEEDGE